MAHDHSPSAADRHRAGSELSEMDVRVRALESLLTAKGYVDPAALDALIETYETQVGPHNGARVVAKAWADPRFREWLLADTTAAIASLGYTGRQGEHLVAVPNTARVHNMVVLHALLLLSVARAGAAAGLVQVGALSRAGSPGSIAALQRALPDLPHDSAGPVFRAPWEAQAFAMTLALHETGSFSWKEWSQTLAAVIDEVRQRGEMDTGEHYYRRWLTALERIAIRRGLVAEAEVVQRRRDWEAAARATPHGEPIRLKEL